MYLTTENAAQYVGKTLDSKTRTFHYYPLRVAQWPSGEYCFIDRNGVAMPVPDPKDRFSVVYFDSVLEEKAEAEHGKKAATS